MAQSKQTLQQELFDGRGFSIDCALSNEELTTFRQIVGQSWQERLEASGISTDGRTIEQYLGNSEPFQVVGQAHAVAERRRTPVHP